ncbi:MFS transporter [Kineosporia corallincola]|uniref:MFS transporter n=1 Tax=Kineosporia corallincola TaxID=2835133 RepID=UPI0035588CFD
MGVREPLRYAAFRWLLAARTTGILGNAVAPIALAFAVLDLTGSAADLGLVVASRSVANVAVLLLGGVVADRLPRQLVLVGTSLVAALTQSTVAVLVLTGQATVPWLMVLGVANGAVAAVSMPASSALVPDTVPPELLRPANALLRLGLNGAGILGAAVGAGLVGALGPGWGLAVDATGFALAGALFAVMSRTMRHAPSSPSRSPRTSTGTSPETSQRASGTGGPGDGEGLPACGPAASRTPATDAQASTGERGGASVLGDLREGWREFSGRRWVWVVVAQFGVLNAAFVGATTVLGPVVADASFGRAAWGLVVAAQTVGLAGGALLALRWRPRHALGIGVGMMALTAVPVLALAVSPRLAVLLVAFAAGGVVLETFAIAWDQALQTHVPRQALSRVYSYDAVGSFVAIPLGEALVGPAAHAVGTRATLLGCAAVIVLASLAAVSVGSVRRLPTDVPPTSSSRSDPV